MSETLTSVRPLPEPEANLGYLFRLAFQRWRALLEHELEQVGLSVQEYGILSVFAARAALSTSELARIAQVTRQTMHSAVLRLEAAGLLERQARNQRVILIGPTRRGRKALEAATTSVRVVELAALADLSGDEERAVRAWLAKVAAMPSPRPRDLEWTEKSFVNDQPIRS
jgi:DNA-binding MarR family transcriptional regulator